MGTRSDLLEGYYQTHAAAGPRDGPTLLDIMPHFAEFAQDKLGSKLLQTRLEEASLADREMAFQQLLHVAAELANSEHGGATLQKMLELSTTEQKKRLAQCMASDVLRLTNEQLGCRVVQHAFMNMPREAQLVLANALKNNVMECIENQHGNHVVQKCIEQMPPDTVDFIIHAVEAQTEKTAVHRYGCRVIQRLLEHCPAKSLERVLEQILAIVPRLAQHRFGNYVIQHLLEHGRCRDKKRVICIMQEGLVMFSKDRCSSNVVEKCIEVATNGEHAPDLEQERAGLIHAVLGEEGDPNPALKQMTEDRFGNYIVQRVWEFSRPNEKDLLYRRLAPMEKNLRNSGNGKHILNLVHGYQKEH
jgi:hypothetical protein